MAILPQNLPNRLKKNFFGIDRVIDEISDFVVPWHQMPDSYIRPIIINLWGMTGTGKTTLVRDISELLDIPLIEMDLGELAGKTSSMNFSEMFFYKYYDFSNKPCIIALDEFHIARTVEEPQSSVSPPIEIDRDKLRGLWSLLSDGKIVINERNQKTEDVEFIFEEAEKEYREDLKFLHEKKNSKNQDDISHIRYIKRKENHEYIGWGGHFLRMFCKMTNIDYAEVRRSLNKDFTGTLTDLKKIARSIKVQPQLDFSKAIIFVLGNLDKLYSIEKDFDPDLDLEIPYEQSLELTVSDVKQELIKRFRTEQIGRLGNNHIIYPSLNREAYNKIIRSDLKRISQFYRKKKNIKINFRFDKTVTEILYKEGVVPAQGARSILSTVGSFFEPTVGRYVTQRRSKIEDPDKGFDGEIINVSFNRKTKMFSFLGKDGIINIPVTLKLDELRKPVYTEKSSQVAVHEAGHILASIQKYGVVPNRASAFCIGSDKSGVVQILRRKKDSIGSVQTELDFLQVCVAGLAAEEIVFGKDNYSLGSFSDLENTIQIAGSLVDSFGYKATLAMKTRADQGSYIRRSLEHDETIGEIVDEAKSEIFKMIENNYEFFKELTKILLMNSMVFKKDIIAAMKKTKTPIADRYSFKNGLDKYFNFENKEIEKGQDKKGSTYSFSG